MAGRSPGFFGSIFDAAGRAFRRGKTAAAAMSYGKSLERLEGSFFYRLFTGLGGLRMKLLRTLSEAYETSRLAGLGERVDRPAYFVSHIALRLRLFVFRQIYYIIKRRKVNRYFGSAHRTEERLL